MAKATVGINFVITQGANGMQQLTVQAKDLRDVMQQTMRITRKLSHETVGFIIRKTKCSRLPKRSVPFGKTKRTSNHHFSKKFRPGFAGCLNASRLRF